MDIVVKAVYLSTNNSVLTSYDTGILSAVASIHDRLHPHHKQKSETSSEVHEANTPHKIEITPSSPVRLYSYMDEPL